MICFLIYMCCVCVQYVQKKYNESMYMYCDMPISVSASIYPCLHFSLSVCLFLFAPCPTHVRSQVFARLVLRLCGGEVILQEGLEILKSVPFIGLPPPALQHQFMEWGGAARGTRHPVAPLHLLQHFTVVHAWRGRGGRGMWTQEKGRRKVLKKFLKHAKQKSKKKTHIGYGEK